MKSDKSRKITTNSLAQYIMNGYGCTYIYYNSSAENVVYGVLYPHPYGKQHHGVTSWYKYSVNTSTQQTASDNTNEGTIMYTSMK